MKTYSGTTPRRVSTIALVAIMGTAALLTTACAEEAPDTIAVGGGGSPQAGTQGNGGGEGGTRGEGGTGGGKGGQAEPEPPAGTGDGGGEGGLSVAPEPPAVPEPPVGGEGGGGEPASEPPVGGEGGGQLDPGLQEFCVQFAQSDLSDVNDLQSLREVAPDELVDDIGVMIEQTPLVEQDPLGADLDALLDATTVLGDYNLENCFTLE